ncbi:MAG: NADH-quinone oxidoreductase subunit L [Gemmatimonadales bacterium]|nr:NADH-quinone oxidoreductase subunit L [Gemmatimonadales bacterium]
MTPSLLLFIPAAGALGTFALRRSERLAGRVALITAAITLGAALWVVTVPASAVWPWGPHLTLRLAPVGFGRVMAVLVPAVALPVLLYANAHEPTVGRPRLLALLLAFVGAMELLVLATDLLTLLVAWELVGAFSWALIGHEWWDPARPRSARHAFLTTRAGDLGLYLAAAAAFTSVGSFGFEELADARGPALGVIAAGVLLAAMAKSAQVPFSPWLFAAMAGPTPASALLHSATMVAAGAYVLIRLGPVLAPSGWFSPLVVAVGLATTFTGGLVALFQSDLKRALAGSTASQYGLMFVAVGAGSTAAAGTHLVTHAAFKALLFLAAGMAIQAAGTGNLDRLRLGRALPYVAAAFLVGVLALAAVPPLGAAYSKELIVGSAWQRAPWLGVTVLASGALTAMYAARLQLLAYGPDGRQVTAVPSRPERVSVWLLAITSVGLGMLWLPGVGHLLASLTAQDVLRGSVGERVASLILTGAAAAAAVVLFRRGVLTTLGVPDPVRGVLADWLGIPGLGRMAVVRPTLALATSLARFDARVVDAGVRAAAAFGRGLARLLASLGEWTLDRAVHGTADAVTALARGSGVADDAGIDAVVERTAAGIGRAGGLIRRLQTGLSHQYFVLLALGLLGAVAAALFGAL